MNKERREKLAALQKEMHSHRKQIADAVTTELQEIIDEEEAAYEAIDEHFPQTEKSEKAELQCDALRDFKDEVESGLMELEERINSYEEAE